MRQTNKSMLTDNGIILHEHSLCPVHTTPEPPHPPSPRTHTHAHTHAQVTQISAMVNRLAHRNSLPSSSTWFSKRNLAMYLGAGGCVSVCMWLGCCYCHTQPSIDYYCHTQPSIDYYCRNQPSTDMLDVCNPHATTAHIRQGKAHLPLRIALAHLPLRIALGCRVGHARFLQGVAQHCRECIDSTEDTPTNRPTSNYK